MLRYLNKRVSCSSRRPKSGLQSSIKWKTDSNLKSRFRSILSDLQEAQTIRWYRLTRMDLNPEATMNEN